jgi:hypothetical protein
MQAMNSQRSGRPQPSVAMRIAAVGVLLALLVLSAAIFGLLPTALLAVLLPAAVLLPGR